MMIVDMLRNDLGRVAEVGSVEVPALYEVERHPTVWQMTSTVTATLRDGVGIDSLFAAMFPSGSVTGAPKVSTMGLIADLEPDSRGVYCGAIGVLPPGGDRAGVFGGDPHRGRESGSGELPRRRRHHLRLGGPRRIRGVLVEGPGGHQTCGGAGPPGDDALRPGDGNPAFGAPCPATHRISDLLGHPTEAICRRGRSVRGWRPVRTAGEARAPSRTGRSK